MGIIRQLNKTIKAYDRNGYGIGEQIDDVRDVPAQLKSIKAAAKGLSDAWEGGDLAEAVRNLLAEVEAL